MKKYSIGLDIGTNSVGWAVVDDQNELVKKNGFTLWGVRMFEEANDASETRTHRSNRRRLQRRKFRLHLLREMFNDEINKVDSTFFERMDDSFYKIEDKKNANYYNLFNNSFTDKEFYDKFPTIFHLRKYLCLSNEKEDIRFIYLALHHMIKYRGNFLYSGDTFNLSDDSRIKNIFTELNVILSEISNNLEDYSEYFSQINLDNNILDMLKAVLISNDSIKNKKINLKNLFGVENKSFVNECIIPLLVSSDCNMSNLYPLKHLKCEKLLINILDENLITALDEAKNKFNELAIILDFLPNIKEIVDYHFLIKLLQGSMNSNCPLSEAMVKKYEDHHFDLIKLKNLIKKHLPLYYDECFRNYDENIPNYVRYIGFNSVENNRQRFSHCSRDDFYNYTKKLLSKIDSENCQNEIDYLKRKIENNNFLLRQNSNQNGSLPMQLNLIEMKLILDKQAKYYQFFNEEDENGIKIKDKIISIFKFVIPYYVGPLNEKSKRSWIVRKDAKIYPWNFDSIVDVDETSKNFIQRMQRKCTYLKGGDDYCLPKKSIIFSKYNCLSYLNKISIDGVLISPKVKNDIYNNVFLKIKKPLKRDIINYLLSNYGNLNITTSKLKDLPEINCDMSSYIKFSEIFEGEVEKNIELIEQIIKDINIFNDKKILEKRLRIVYKLNEEKIKKIKDLNYKDYGNLSYKLLCGLHVENLETGEINNVIEIMENSNYVLNEILFAPEYRLIDIINDYNKNCLVEVNYESLDEFINENISISPIMKRPIIQAHTIIKEVEKILGTKIDKFYIECTRTNSAKKEQSKSRYIRLKELYDSCKKMSIDFDIDFNKLENELNHYSENLKSDLLYLYFVQLGKCMYTLEDINLNDLMFNNYKWDIDHIYPQALIKDDSFNNKVLVLKSKNNAKQDNLLFELPSFLNKNCYAFYEKLKEMQLITKEKYRRLTKKELSSGELESFVNRQVVSTNQSVKGLIQTLKIYDNVNPSNIVYSKAENISLARQLFDLPKSRTANNYHHAHDAYLNVVIGRVINDYFTKNHFTGYKDYYRLKVEKKTINVENILKYDTWYNGNLQFSRDEVINLINKNLYNRYDVSETTRTSNSNQLFSKVTIQPAGKGTVPIKINSPVSDIVKYGGITSYSYCKYVIVKVVNKKGIEEFILESIPTAYNNKESMYLEQRGYSNFNIVHNNIKTNVVIKHESLKYCITGKSSEVFILKNLSDRYFKKNIIKIIKKLDKYNDNIAKESKMAYYDDYVVIAPARDEKCSEIILNKNELLELLNELKLKFSKSVYKFSVIINIVEKLNIISVDSFDLLELIKINNELLKLLQTNSRKLADLKLIGMSSNSGALTTSKKLKKGMKFISESVTGYYEKLLYEVK